MIRNYLEGLIGDTLNLTLAAAFYLMKFMRRLKYFFVLIVLRLQTDSCLWESIHPRKEITNFEILSPESTF